MEEHVQSPSIQIAAGEMDEYRQTALRRRQERREALAARLERAWQTARTAAELLKRQYGAQRVAVYGSLVHPDLFHERSDLDLAAWGLDERLYYRALADLLCLDPLFPVDLVEFEHARPALQERIEREGEEL